MEDDKMHKTIGSFVDAGMTFLIPLMSMQIWNWYAVKMFGLPPIKYLFTLLVVLILDSFRCWLLTLSVAEFKARIKESEEDKCMRKIMNAISFTGMFVILFLVHFAL